MIKRREITILAVVATLVITAAVIAALLSAPSGSTKRRASTSHPAATNARPTSASAQTNTATQATATSAPSETNDQLAPAGEPDARLVVQRFLRAFARYEITDITAGVRRELRATTTPNLASTLLGRPPRPLRGARPPAAARLADLTVTGTSPAGTIEYLVDLDRDGTRESFSLTASPTGEGWRVQRLNGA